MDAHVSHKLNESQKSAVMTTEGPVLIVAGPGTGKTLTIVHRLAYLIHTGVNPENIVAVTFTNRAAKEMKERAEVLLGQDSVDMFIGTFHMLGLKIIRDTLSKTFVLYNSDERIHLLKALSKKPYTEVRRIAGEISRIKNFIGDADDDLKGIYREYQGALTKNSALDFDDLILKPIDILGDGAVSEKYREIFKYIIVDEYQDINPAQYRLLRLLAGDKGDICAVGDADQAIYAFRGADMENFLNFKKDFKDAKTIHLTENYRSTGAILDASNSLINNNLKRMEKRLKTVREKGDRITIISAPDEKAEGVTIIREIEKRMGGTSHYQMTLAGAERDFSGRSYRFSDFAVIFRTNAQAKAIEDAFIASGIPYQVIGGTHLPKNNGIADILSYLTVLINPMDDFNFRRAVSMPPSGMDDEDIRKICRHAEENGLCLYEAMKAATTLDGNKKEFVSMLDEFMDLKNRVPVDELLKKLLEESGIGAYYKNGEDTFAVLENLAAAYRDIEPAEAIIRFTHEAGVLTREDSFDPAADAVTVMTLHTAKGLEFRVVFIAGVESGLVPYTIKKDGIDIEEERRLFYVGMTRAKDELFLVYARKRFLYGQRLDGRPSSFLKEIPEHCLWSRVVPDKIQKGKKEKQPGLF